MALITMLARYDASLKVEEGKQRGDIILKCVPMSTGAHRLNLIFQDPSDALLPNTYDAAAQVGVAYQPFSQYHVFLDLIRNEAPIFVFFKLDATPPRFTVMCSAEPAGEGETWI